MTPDKHQGLIERIEAMTDEQIDILARFLRGDRTMLTCTLCGASSCDCWTKCPRPGCAWSFEKGTKCRNPAHTTGDTQHG